MSRPIEASPIPKSLFFKAFSDSLVYGPHLPATTSSAIRLRSILNEEVYPAVADFIPRSPTRSRGISSEQFSSLEEITLNAVRAAASKDRSFGFSHDALFLEAFANNYSDDIQRR